MALSRNCSLCLKLGFTLALLLSLAFLPSQSVIMARKLIGSRPPGCVNKCMTCQPCKATLVISPSLKNKGPNNADPSKTQDDTYYLLSWKCRCRDKIFQP